MKYISLLCVALLVTVGLDAQISDPCVEGVSSTWNGVGQNVPFTALTGYGFSFCDSINAPVGFYKHIQGDFANSIPPSWADDEVYGLVGTGSINGIASGEYMTASVLETRLSVVESSLQYYENPVMTLASGNWRFNRIYIDGATTLRIEAGTNVEVLTALHISGNGKLVVEEGATFTLKNQPGDNAITGVRNNAIIDCDYGTITGKITEEIYLYSEGASSTEELRFGVYPHLKNIDLDAVMTQLLDTIDPGGSNDTQVQVAWLNDYLNPDDYGFTANNAYYDAVLSSATPVEDLTKGFVTRDYNSFSFTGTAFKRPAINAFEYSPTLGVSIAPIYTGSSTNDLTSLLSNPQLEGIQAGVTTATAEELSEIATTTNTMDKPFVIILGDVADSQFEDMVLAVTGTWEPDNFVTYNMKNTQYDPNDDPEYDAENLSPFFEKAPVINTPIELLYNNDFFSATEYTGALNYSGSHRGMDFTGLNVLKSKDVSPLSMRRIVDQIKEHAPHSSRSFYNLVPMVSFMPDRKFAQELINNYALNVYAGKGMPMKIADYLDFYDHEYNTWRTLDLYHLNGTEEHDHMAFGLGECLEPYQMVGYNYTNHYDISEYDGTSFPINPISAKKRFDYTNMGGQYNVVTEDTVVFASDKISSTSKIVMQNIENNGKYSDYFVDNTYQNAATLQFPCSGNENCELDIAALNAMNEFTLLRLVAQNSLGDKVTCAMLPLAFGTQYDGNELDAFEYSIAPSPIMSLLRQENGEIGSLRYGSFSKSVYNVSDTLKLVVDFNALDFALDHSEGDTWTFYIDSPIGQTPDQGWPAWWHYTASNPGETTQWIHTQGFNMPVTRSAIQVPDAVGVGAETTYGDIITLNARPYFGDTNHDGVISTTDVLNFLGQFGQAVTNANEHLDFNNDGIIGNADFLVLLQYFGQIYPNEVYGAEGFDTPSTERLKFLIEQRDNNHIAYDWRDYPGFTVADLAYLQTCDLTGRYVVCDECSMDDEGVC